MMKKRMTLVGLIAATYFIVSGGPYGLEDLIAQTGYGLGILILCLVPFLWALPTALMVGELASAIPDNGGFYIWVQRALGKFWGFQEVWLSLAASIFDMGIYPLLFVSYLGVLYPALTTGWHGSLIATALVGACLLWNIKGARAVGAGSTWMGLAMVAPFAVLTGAALFHAHTAGAVIGHPSQGTFIGGILVAMWNFMGWDNASTIATEVENPQRNYPRAMLATLSLIVVSYVLPILAAWFHGVPLSGWSTGSWAAIGGILAGPWVRDAIVIGGLLSATGMLNSLMMSYSRLPAAMAEDGFLPKVFTHINEASVPLIALFTLSTVWLTAFGLNFNRLVMLDILLYGSSLVLEFVALAVLRWKEPDLVRPFKVPGGKLGAIACGIAPCALLALAGIQGEHSGLGIGLGVILGGFSVYGLIHLFKNGIIKTWLTKTKRQNLTDASSTILTQVENS
jgi:amino acid transporter